MPSRSPAAWRARVTVHSVLAALAVAAALAAGLVLAAHKDLALDEALLPLWQQAQAQHAAGEGSLWFWWAVLAEAAGTLPAWGAFALVGWCVCLTAGCGRRLRAAPLAGGAVLLAGGCALLARQFCAALGGRGIPVPTAAAQAGLGLLAGALLFAATLARRLGGPMAPARLRRWQALTLLYAGMALAQWALIHLLKPIWQRARFDELLAAGTTQGYTPWTVLPGSGGSSFPSGHTGSAAVLLILVCACRLFDACRGDEGCLLFWGYAFGGAVGFGRMLIGRHYLGDVLAALAIDSLLLALVWFTPLYGRLLAWAASADAGEKAAAAAPRRRPKAAHSRRPKQVFRAPAHGRSIPPAAPKPKAAPPEQPAAHAAERLPAVPTAAEHPPESSPAAEKPPAPPQP